MGGKLSRPVYLDPYPLGYQSKIILLSSTYFKLSECEDVSIITHNSSQIQLFSLSDCSVCLVAYVGGKLSRPVYLAPHPPEYQSKSIVPNSSYFKLSECDDVSIITHNSSEIQLFSLLDCSVYLVTGVGGKLSRPVYLDPHPPEYQSKIILPKCSHFKLSKCDDVSIINIIQVKFSCFLCWIVPVHLLQGWGVSCPGQFILTPTQLSIKVKLFC